MLLIFLVNVKIQSRTHCAPRTTLNGNLSWGGKWLCVVRTALFLGHIAFNLKVIFAAVEKISGIEQQVLVSHFSCQQIQGCFGWVLLILLHRLKEQFSFENFHSSDKGRERELVRPCGASSISAGKWHTHICSHLIRQSRSCGQGQSLWGWNV